MAKDLQNIFESITPDNIKDIPLIEDAMKIFVETLEEMSKESIDVKNVYNNDVIREELIKIYLDDLYRVFKSIQLNQKIIDRIDRINAVYDDDNQYFNKDAILNMASYLNDEHFMTIRSFKESKGTEKAIEYMYKLISVFVSPSDDGDSFEFIENGTFDYTIRGSLPEELYNYIVAPLAHPLGFTYAYEQYLSLVLEDFFPGENISYDIIDLEVRCLFPDGSTRTTDYKYYYDENGNVITDEDGTPIERVVVSSVILNEVGSRTKIVRFEDGTYLKQVSTSNGQTTVYFMDENDEVLVHYNQQCSIYFNFIYNYDTSLGEEFSSVDTKTTFDYYARLDSRIANTIYIGLETDPLLDDIGEFTIGSQMDSFDIGFNLIRDRDGNNLLPSGMQGTEYGRQENAFSPSEIADLKMLSGEYEKDVLIYWNGDYLETQHIVYTNVVNPDYRVVDRVNTVETYIQQNIGNEDYLAHEHHYHDVHVAPSLDLHIEPAYIGTHAFIDANGVDRGPFPGYAIIGGNYDFDRSQTEVAQLIGYDPFTGDGTYIGGFIDDQEYLEDLSFTFNPNDTIQYFETYVKADPVDLQMKTYDVFDCGVYRDDVLLEDGNYSALSI